ncbi:hypothetical protein BsWGS_18353 [Bradybaena similaris]
MLAFWHVVSDGSRHGHNASFQSCTSTFGPSASLKSSVKDPIRSSARKHVTFKETGRLRNSACSHSAAMLAKSGPSGNSLSPDTGATLCHLAGALQKQPINAFTGVISPKEHSLHSEMNIPVSIDNSNLNVDSPKYTSSAGYSHSKGTIKEIASRYNYTDEHMRDSPRLTTFASAALPQQSFQKHSHPPNALYNGEDNIPSPMPRESPSEWRTAPGMLAPENPCGQTQKKYIPMSAARDLLKPQSRNSQRRSPSPHVQQKSFMLTGDTSSSAFSTSYHRNTDPIQETSNVNSFTDEINRGQYSSSKDSLNVNQSTSLTSTFNHCRPSSPMEAPAPRLPLREAKAFNGPVLLEHSLQDKAPAKYPVNPSPSQIDLPEHMTAFPYDWTNHSIVTTDDLDDQRSTTTSGSYTVDNEDDYLALEFKPKDVVV